MKALFAGLLACAGLLLGWALSLPVNGVLQLQAITHVQARVYDPLNPYASWISFNPQKEPRPDILSQAPSKLIEYRYELSIPSSHDRHSKQALLFSQAINGVQLQTGGVLLDSLPLSNLTRRTVWYRPALVTLPTAHLDAPLVVYTRSWEPHLFLSPMFVGEYNTLFWVHEVINFVSTSLAYAGTLISFLFGCFFLYVWTHNRAERLYFFAAFTAICWCALFALADLPSQEAALRPVWRFLIYCTIAGSFWGITQFIVFYTGGELSPALKKLCATLSFAGPAMYLSGQFSEPVLDQYWTLSMYVVAAPGVWFLVRHWWIRRSEPLTVLMTASTLVCLAFAYQGQQLISGFVGGPPAPQAVNGWSFLQTPVYVINLALPVFFGISSVVFANRYQAINSQLAQAADLMERTLHQQALEIHALNAERLDREKREAADIERNLIHRDLHDGIGARLVASLYQLREGRLSTQQMEDALVSSLTDIKKIVQHDDAHTPVDIVNELFARCLEMEDIFSPSGIRFTYDIPDHTGLCLLGRADAHILFIFQEIVTNFLKHSAGKKMHVELHIDDCLRLIVHESGYAVEHGMRAINTLQQNLSSGRGLSNIQARALSIGADIDIVQDTSFRTTTLHLPWTPTP